MELITITRKFNLFTQRGINTNVAYNRLKGETYKSPNKNMWFLNTKPLGHFSFKLWEVNKK